MRGEPRWVSEKALLLLHEESLAEFGGRRGVRRDHAPGLDDSLKCPADYYRWGMKTKLAELAAYYAYLMVKHHAVNGGRKRLALLAMGLFLALNGKRLTASQAEAAGMIRRLEVNGVKEEELARWVERNME